MRGTWRSVGLIILLLTAIGALVGMGMRPCAWLDTTLRRSCCSCTLFETEHPVVSITFSPDGDYLAVSLINGSVQLWDVAGRKPLLSLDAPAPGADIWAGNSYDLAFSPDGTLLALGRPDGTIHLWRLSRDEQGLRAISLRTLADDTKESSKVSTLAFSPNGQTLLAGTWDGWAYLWHVEEGVLVQSWPAHGRGVMSAAFAPDGRKLASASLDSTVKLWNIEEPRSKVALLHKVERTSIVTGVAFSPDGSLLAIDHDLWNVGEWSLHREMEVARGGMSNVMFSPDGELLAAGNAWYEVLWWRVTDGALLGSAQKHTDSVRSIAFSPDGAVLASGSLDGSVRLWDMSSIGR